MQIIDKFCSSSLMIFLNMAYIVISVGIKNGKIFHLLCIFHHHGLVMFCLYLAFIAQYSNVLYPSSQLSHNMVLLFNLYTESKILTFASKNGRPDIVTRKVSNEKLI